MEGNQVLHARFKKRNFAHIKQGAFIKLKRYLLRMELGRMTWRKDGEVRSSIIFSH